MRSNICWIDQPNGSRLGIMARPRAGDWLDDEIALWRDDGVAAVISLLEPEETEELDLGREAELCRRNGIEFHAFPIPDRGVPDYRAAARIALSACEMTVRGQPTAIHCRAGIGRSSLMAGAVMVCSGVEPAKAFEAIASARGTSVPDTEEQRQWLFDFAAGLGALDKRV